MQKVYLHFHKNVEKDKPKEPKTTPVPVDPKRAGQVREADKKLFEKLNKIGAAMLIGFLLFTNLPDQYKVGLGFAAHPSHTPPQHHNQGLGGTLLPVPEVGVEPAQDRRTDRPKAVFYQPIQQAESTIPPPADTRCDFVLCEHVSTNQAASPLSGVLETVLSNWKAPINTEILNVNQLEIEWKNELDFIEKIQQRNLNRPLTLVTLELQEFKESSGKDLYTLVPENKARIKLTMRGLDAASKRLLFEETVEREIIQSQWANYENSLDTGQSNRHIYPYSLAMKQALLETSNEIITLLHKYFPE